MATESLQRPRRRRRDTSVRKADQARLQAGFVLCRAFLGRARCRKLFQSLFFFNFNLKNSFRLQQSLCALLHVDIKMHLDSEPKWPIQSFTIRAFSAGEAENSLVGGAGVLRRGRDWSGVWRGGDSFHPGARVPEELRSQGPSRVGQPRCCIWWTLSPNSD